MAIITQVVKVTQNQETLHIMLIGSRETLTAAIHILDRMYFAQATNWCEIQETENEGDDRPTDG